jgi:hypothetical protein
MGKPKSHQKVEHVPGPPKRTRQGQGQHPAHCNLIARCTHEDVL